MTLAAIRRGMQPRATLLRTVLLTAVGVAALMFGLLAMHTLNLAGPHHEAAASVSQTDHSMLAAGDDSHESSAAECGEGGCGVVDSMGAMACVLALLVAAIAFAAPAVRTRWMEMLPQLVAAPVRVEVTSPEHPPSLIALSISRT